MEAILGKREIGRRTGLSERTIRRLEERGEFNASADQPRPIGVAGVRDR